MSKIRNLRDFVRSIILEHSDDTHRCFDGSLVPIESETCYDDVCARIEDATEIRNSCPKRSDAREHYNGVLKVLRRKHRKAKKFMDGMNI